MPNTGYNFATVERAVAKQGYKLRRSNLVQDTLTGIIDQLGEAGKIRPLEVYQYSDYIPGMPLSIRAMNKELRLPHYKLHEEIALGPSQVLKHPDVLGTVQKMVSLNIIPDDRKSTLDSYGKLLDKHIRMLQVYTENYPVALPHRFLDIQLNRLMKLRKIMQKVSAPKMTSHRYVSAFATWMEQPRGQREYLQNMRADKSVYSESSSVTEEYDPDHFESSSERPSPQSHTG